MTVEFSGPFVAALASWRRDRVVLLPLAGLTMFVPQLAVLLLVPEMPKPVAGEATEEATRAWMEAVTTWAGAHGLWYLLAPAIGLLGALAVIALYLDPGRPTLARALARAALLFPRYLLAALLVAFPLGALLVPALASPPLLIVLLAPIFYVFGRTMLVGPAIVAEAPLGAVAAVARSWALTRGRGWVLACVYAAIMLGAQMLGGVFLSVGSAMAGGGTINPVLVAIVDGFAALSASAAALTLALVEVALYRRVASSGT